MGRFLLFALLLTAAAHLAADPQPRVVRILFVGNSLTDSNDLPQMVAGIGAAAGVEIVTEMVPIPNFALEDHLSDGRAVAALQRQKWDYVVLQQGPSALDESRVSLIRNTRRFADVIRKHSAEPVVMMVWPSRARSGDFEDVATSARLAAKAVHGKVIPAGQSWREAWRRSPSLELYASDGFHPSGIGTYLAALTTYRTLVGPLPRLSPSDELRDPDLQVLLHAAAVAHPHE
jgi:hypothetical protein